MEKWLNENDSMKRLLLGGLTTVLLSFNNKLGLGLTDAAVASIAALVGSMILGSNIHAAAKAKGEAAAASVKTVEDAAKVLGGEVGK